MGADIDRLEIQIESSAKQVNIQLDSLINRLEAIENRLPSIGNSVGFDGLRANIKETNKVFGEFRLDSVYKSSRNVAFGFAKMYACLNLLKRGFSSLSRSIQSSMNYVETLNYFDAAFEQVAGNAVSQWETAGYDSAESYYKSFSARAKELTGKMTGFSISENGMLTETGAPSLGIDPGKLMNYQAMFAQMSSSIGVTSETSLKLSQALTEIGADLASVKNMDFDKVWKDMASGLAGMSRTLDKYGVNIRNVNLQQKLTELGIKANIQALNQNEKALLRGIILLDSTKYAWGDLADTLNLPANQLRLLSANFGNLARAIGNLFLPVVAKVLPYINGLVMALQRLAVWVGSFWGKDLTDLFGNKGGGGSDDLSDFLDSAEGASDALGSAADNAKKLKNITMGIDELNIVSQPDDSGSGSGAGSGIGSGLLDDAFLGAFDDYQKAWDEAFAGVENKAQKIADSISDALKKIWEYAEPAREALKKLWNEGLKQLADFSVGTLKDFYNEFLVPIGKWTLGEGLPRFFNITNDLLTGINWGRLKRSLHNFYKELANFTKFSFTAVLDFYENFIAPIGKWTMNRAIPTLVDAITDLSKKIDWLKFNDALSAFWRTLSKFAVGIGEGLICFFEGIEPVLTSTAAGIVNGLSVAFEKLFSALSIIPDGALVAAGGALAGILSTVVAYKGAAAIMDKIQLAWIGLYAYLDDGLKLLASHPYVAIAGGIAAICGAFASYMIYTAKDNPIYKLSENLGIAADSIATATQRVKDCVNDVSWSAAGESDIKLLQDLSTEYFNLRDKKVKSNDETQKMIDLAARLVDSLPDLKQYYDEQTGYIDTTKNAVTDLINEKLREIKISAAEDKYKEIYQAQLDAISELEPRMEALRQAKEKENELWKLYTQYATDAAGAQRLYNSALNEGADTTTLARYLDQMASANQMADDAYAKLEAFRNSDGFTEATASVEEYTTAMTDAGDKLAELQAFISDTNTATSQMPQYVENVAKAFELVGEKPEQALKSAQKALGTFRVEAEKAGSDIPSGLASGIDSNTGIVYNAGKNVGDEAISGARTALDSHSPSRVFKGIGSDVVAGFNIGINENAITTKNAIAEWMNSIKESFSMEYLSEAFSGMMTGFQMKWNELSEWWSGEAMPVFFEERVNPYFSEETWLTTADGMKTGILNKLVEFEELWKTSISKWWNTSVSPWFTIEKWKLFGTNMKNGLFTGFKGIVEQVGGIMNGLIDVFDKALSNIEDAINELIEDFNDIASQLGVSKLHKVHAKSIGHVEIPQFYDGGFPTSGEMFLARENGINEYVGRIGNRSAVANNDQIVEGVARGVASGISSANDTQNELLREQNELLRMLLEKDVSLNLDDRDIFKASERGRRSVGLQLRTT